MKKILLIVTAFTLLVGCSKDTGSGGPTVSDNSKKINSDVEADLIKYEEQPSESVTYEVEHGEDSPVAVIILEDGSKIVVELYPEYAPNTVNNFIYLANEKHFYDGLIFHRVISEFMVQAGCPYGTGIGNPGYSIPGEFSENEFTQNTLLNKTGTIAMARSTDPDSAGSQFYINVNDNTDLDGKYAVFGKVISGYDKVAAISVVETNADDKPLESIVISSVRVDTKGKDYYQPVVSE